MPSWSGPPRGWRTRYGACSDGPATSCGHPQSILGAWAPVPWPIRRPLLGAMPPPRGRIRLPSCPTAKHPRPPCPPSRRMGRPWRPPPTAPPTMARRRAPHPRSSPWSARATTGATRSTRAPSCRTRAPPAWRSCSNPGRTSGPWAARGRRGSRSPTWRAAPSISWTGRTPCAWPAPASGSTGSWEPGFAAPWRGRWRTRSGHWPPSNARRAPPSSPSTSPPA